jgi:hypothetical protein
MDKTAICNQALVEAEIDSTISSVETDSSIEAERMRRIYNSTKEECLSDYNWGFATKFVFPAGVDLPTDSPYSYAFSYPDDAIVIQGLYENNTAALSRSDSLQYSVATTADGTARILLCNVASPILVCTINVTDEILPNYFVRYFYLNLALKIAKLSGAATDVKTRLFNEIAESSSKASEHNAIVINRKYDDEENYYIDVRG